MKHAIETLKKERDSIIKVITPFNKENNSEAYKKALKKLKETNEAILVLNVNKL